MLNSRRNIRAQVPVPDSYCYLSPSSRKGFTACVGIATRHGSELYIISQLGMMRNSQV